MTKKRRKNNLALLQAANLLRDIKALNDIANKPAASIDLADLASRALTLLGAVHDLRTQNPGGIVTADEIKALTRPDGDAVH